MSNRWVGYVLCAALAFSGAAFAAEHPMDPLSPHEIDAAVKILKDEGVAGSRARFPFIRLYEMPKAEVLKWSPGDKISRKAEAYVNEDGTLLRTVIDLDRGTLEPATEITSGQPPFQLSDFMNLNSLIVNNAEWRAAIRKRGITDYMKVINLPFSVGYFGDPADKERRLFKVGSYYPEDTQNYWGRQIGGLSALVDLTNKKIVNVVDTGVVPLPTGNAEYSADAIEGGVRKGPNRVDFRQPGGASFAIDGHILTWQKWRFHYRIEPHAGLVLSNVTYDDNGATRSVLYQASLSELFVPYMDPSEAWHSRTFIDAGEYGIAYTMTPMVVGADCPEHATLLGMTLPGITGRPQVFENVLAVFERTSGDPAWRHIDPVTGQSESRRAQELVLRFIATVGNYDYLFDWVFRQDGGIQIKVGATGICSAKSVASRTVAEDADGVDQRYGRFVADHTVAVNHDHYVIYRLDFDVDGTDNAFSRDALKKVRWGDETPRTSGWVVDSTIAEREHDAKLIMNTQKPSMWRVLSSSAKNAWGYPTSYVVKPNYTSISLLDPDDWAQRRGAFSAYNLYVTPYRQLERHAVGDFPNQGDDTTGIEAWTAANRPIKDTDIVAWYSVGFHHVVRAEDWPVMPTAWHTFSILPFDFFDRNPALDLPPS